MRGESWAEAGGGAVKRRQTTDAKTMLRISLCEFMWFLPKGLAPAEISHVANGGFFIDF